MNNTVRNFRSKLKEVRPLYRGPTLFTNLNRNSFLEVIENYISKSTQDEFNFITLLEVKKAIQKENLVYNFDRSYYRFMKTILTLYYEKNKSPLVFDFLKKYNKYMTYIKSKNYSSYTLKLKKSSLKNILFVLELFESKNYNSEICTKAVLTFKKIAKDNLLNKRYSISHIRTLNSVLEFDKLNTVSTKYGKGRLSFPILPTLKPVIENYLQHRKKFDLLKDQTIIGKRICNERFAKFFGDNGYENWYSLNNKIILDYVHSLSFMTISQKKNDLQNLKQFFKFLFEKEITSINFSFSVPSVNYSQNAHLPSMYTPDEIEKTLNTIDRASVKGKRDYCLLLILARYGLRASDICKLKHENIDWNRDEIKLVQQKTNNEITFPLFAEVGNAIIDYYKIRPKLKSPYIFLQLLAPYKELASSTIGSITTERMREAKINIRNRKHGPHAWRHSLSGKLMETNTPINIISGVLGHSNIDTTAEYYISSNLKQLRECSLEVLFDLPGNIQAEVEEDKQDEL